MARLAWWSLRLAIHDHLRLHQPAGSVEGLLALSEQAILCASAGHLECMLRVPSAMVLDGQEKMSVQGVLEALDLWGFLRPVERDNREADRPLEVYVDLRGNATTPEKAARMLSLWMNQEGDVSRVEEWFPNAPPAEGPDGLPGPDSTAPPRPDGSSLAQGAA